MIRTGLFFSAFFLVACGADSTAKRPASPALASEASPELPRIELPGGLSALGIYRVEDSEMRILALHEEVKVFSSAGEASSLSIASPIAEPHLLDLRGESVWMANHDQLVRLHPEDRQQSEAVTMEGTKASAIEVAYQGTVFVADAQANRILAVTGDKVETLVEDPALGQPSALLLNGGSLIIGNKTGLVSFNIKSGESKVLADNLDPVVALAHDHLGYYIAATSNGEIFQVQPDGSSKALHNLEQAPSGIAFDDKTRRLYLASGELIQVHDYLTLTGEDQELWSKRDERLMRPFTKNGMTLAGGEYWPSHGKTNVSYPEDILWGFYPSPDEVIEGEAAAVAPPAAAIQCAEQSYKALQAFVDSNPEQFHAAAEASGASKQFYLWVNDYSDADADFPYEQRMNKFWYWERKPAVLGRVPGFWKWETTLLQDGSCLWPQADQIEQYLGEKLSAE
jgi:hypothetical protein